LRGTRCPKLLCFASLTQVIHLLRKLYAASGMKCKIGTTPRVIVAGARGEQRAELSALWRGAGERGKRDRQGAARDRRPGERGRLLSGDFEASDERQRCLMLRQTVSALAGCRVGEGRWGNGISRRAVQAWWKRLSHPKWILLASSCRRVWRASVRRGGRRAEESACDGLGSETANGRPYREKRRVRGWPAGSGTAESCVTGGSHEVRC